MKKAILLVAALVVIASLAFADGTPITFGMWGRTAYNVVSVGPNLATPMTGFGGMWPPMPRENLDFGWMGDKMGFHFTAYFDGGMVTMTNLYGTLKVVPDMATILIGGFNGDGWDTFRLTSPSPYNDMNENNVGRFSGYGIIADVAPKGTGFEAAAMWRTNVATGNVSGAGQSFAAQDLMGTALNTDIAAAYTVPDLVKVTLGSTVDSALYPSQTVRDIFGRVQVLAVKNLTAWAEGKFTGLEGNPEPKIIGAEIAGGYVMDALNVILAAQISYTMPESGDATFGWEVRPEAWYTLGPVSAGLYLMAKNSGVKDSPISYEVQPGVKFNDFSTFVSVDVSGSLAAGSVAATTPACSLDLRVDFGF